MDTWIDDTGYERGVCATCGDECNTHPDVNDSLHFCSDCNGIVCSCCVDTKMLRGADLCPRCAKHRKNDSISEAMLREYIAEALGSTPGSPYIRNATSLAMSDSEEIGPISHRDIDSNDDEGDEPIASHLVDIEVTPEDCYGPVPPDAEDPYVQQDPFARDWSVLPTSPIRRG